MTSFQKNLLLESLNKHKQLGFEYIDNIDKLNNKIVDEQLPDNLDLLKDHVMNCNLCSLSKKTEERFFGMGDLNSDLYIIISNKYLLNDINVYNMLKNMVEKVLMIDFSKVYLVSLVKCTTSSNTRDLSSEIDICMSYVKKQLSLAKPKLLLVFGDAYKYMLDSNEKLIDIAGNLYSYDHSKLIPLLDPEFIIKNPSYKEYALNNLKKVKSIMESL
jgi:DNA polymerase